MVDKKIEKTKCVGCKMCAEVCPQNAISFETNDEGYWYPVCDANKCTNCGCCVARCPINENQEVYTTERKCYCAWSRNDDIRRSSTSGGLYYEFANKILNDGGYIVGSVYAEDYCSAYHIITNNKNDLSRVMGSKYFQSDTEGIYIKIRELLMNGEKVLFTGTPCQAAALDKFLGRKYENLIIVDFLCRGVPSPLLQKKKIELYVSKAKAKVVFYSDKTKPFGWSNFGETIRFDNGKKEFISRWRDDINDCFIEKNLNLRESCYRCMFKDGNRASDLTIGDFWGVTNVTEKDLIYGVSCLITNTVQGEKFIEELGNCIYKGQRPIGEVSAFNRAYIESAKRPDERDSFFQEVLDIGLEQSVKKYTAYSTKRKINNSLKVIKGKIKTVVPRKREIKDLNFIKFLHYNFFCKQIHREKGAYILPYKGAYLSIGRKAEIHLGGNMLINYYPVYSRGTEMTRFRVEDGARLTTHNRVELSYGNTLSLSKNAKMEIGYFYTGVGANIICDYKMTIGNNVMIGRDVCIFDSDYHKIFSQEGEVINPKKEVIIEDNCWLGARSMVLKGSHIKEGAIISANSMVIGDVEGNRVFVNKRESKSIGKNIMWERF